MQDENTHHPICPKCGYDQTGIFTTWVKQCPVRGTCPECGFDFDWADVINPSRVELGWYVEHARSRQGLIRRTIPTLWYLLIPNRYWAQMRMESPRSLRTYLLWIVLMMVVLHFIASIARIGAVYSMRAYENQIYAQMIASSPPHQQAQATKQYAPFMHDLGSFDFWYPTIMGSLLEPFMMRYLNSSSLLQVNAVPLALGMLGICLMWFVMFCAFPISRKRAQLRVVHVWRATIVAGFLPMLLIEVSRLIGATVDIFNYSAFGTQRLGQFGDLIGLGMLIAVLIWVQWFWVSAVRIGWQVRANWFSVFLVIIASLFGVTIGGALMAIFNVISSAVNAMAVWMGV